MSEEKPEPGISPSADWREPDHYNPLLNCDRHCWAGEWLRRNPAFLADLREARCSPPDESGHILCDQDCRLAQWGVRCCRIDGENGVLLAAGMQSAGLAIRSQTARRPRQHIRLSPIPFVPRRRAW